MKRIPLDISDQEFTRLNLLYQQTGKSSTVGGRALELVRFYFRSQDATCEIIVPGNGCDIEVRINRTTHRIEVKGTADINIAWSKLKVSGKPSYDALVSGMPLYRVTGVYERKPVLFILTYANDFDIQPEARWSLRQKA